MSVKILVPADDVWDCFKEHHERLEKEMVLVAENTDTKYAVYMTLRSGVPYLSVCKGDNFMLMQLSEYGFDIYRPFFLHDDDKNCEIFVEYPYE